MNVRAKLYLASVSILGVFALLLLDWSSAATLDGEHFVGAFAFLSVCLLSDSLTVKYTVGQQQPSSSIAFLPYFASALLFGPPVAVVIVLATMAWSQFALQKRPMLTAVFNISQVVLSLIIGCLAYSIALGPSTLKAAESLLTLRGFTAFAVLAITFFVANQLLISTALALTGGGSVRSVFRKVIGLSGANLLYDVIASPFAAIFVLLYTYFKVPGVLMVVMPLLLIRHSYKTNLNLQQANKDLLTVLIKTIETRDPYTSGHSIRVSVLAKAIAEDLGLSMTKIDRIETSAIVHDIGKVDAIYAAIIRKEGSLTEAERKIIVTHAAKGAEFLKTLASFHSDVIAGVRHHHERFDGTGYPDGLSGDTIPLAARIIMLCDSIDAMLSDRPYRKALTVEHVRGELLRCAGTQFDPQVVDVILKKNTLERAAALVRPDSLAPRTKLAVSA